MNIFESLQYLSASTDSEGHCSEGRVAGAARLHHSTRADEEVVHPPHFAVRVYNASTIVLLPHPRRTLQRNEGKRDSKIINNYG